MQKQKHTTGGIPRWSPTLVLVARFSAYVWQSGRDAQFSLTYGRMCLSLLVRCIYTLDKSVTALSWILSLIAHLLEWLSTSPFLLVTVIKDQKLVFLFRRRTEVSDCCHPTALQRVGHQIPQPRPWLVDKAEVWDHYRLMAVQCAGHERPQPRLASQCDALILSQCMR